MSLGKLLAEIENQGLRLEALEGRLRYFPAEKVSDGLRREMVAHKAELLNLFRRPDAVHFALKDKADLGRSQIEPCLVGCGEDVRFYYLDGVDYGYCSRCDVHQRAVIRPE